MTVSIGKVHSAGGAAAYFAADNYYTAEQSEAVSAWAGEGAKDLGLSGTVDTTTFERILSGELPDGKQIGDPATRDSGRDFTFSMPKSASLLALVSGDKRILAAHMETVKQTMAWAEKNFAEARVHVDGKDVAVRTGNLVYALFPHDTSRATDPQSHIHAVIANLSRLPEQFRNPDRVDEKTGEVIRDDGWRAWHNGTMYRASATLTSMANAILREKIEALGYKTEITGKHGAFELLGPNGEKINKEALDGFSKRGSDIKAKAEELGVHSPEGRRAITQRTRDPKMDAGDRAELAERWRAEARDYRYNGDQIYAMALVRSRERSSPIERGILAVSTAIRDSRDRLVDYLKRPEDPLVDSGLAKLTRTPATARTQYATASAIRILGEREAVFSTADVIKTAVDLGEKGVTPERIERRIAELVEKGEIVPETSQRLDKAIDMITTREAIEQERRILKAMDTGAGEARPLMSADVARDRLQELAVPRELNTEQLAAAIQIVSSPDRIVLVQGRAGAGKSTMLQPVAKAEAIDATARLLGAEDAKSILLTAAMRGDAQALAFQNKMVADLRTDTGMESRTVDSFIYSNERFLNGVASAEAFAARKAELAGTYLILDEASMISNERMDKLTAIANLMEVGRLAIIGDRKQLNPIDAGKSFSVMQARAIQDQLPVSEVNINMRQKTEDMRLVADLADAGNVRGAIAILGDRVIESKTRIADAAGAWLALSADERNKTTLLPSSRDGRAEANQIIQDGLKAEGTLKGEGRPFNVRETLQLTREEYRYARNWKAAQFLEVGSRDNGLGLPKGDYHIDRVFENGRVELRDMRGRKHRVEPATIDPNGKLNRLKLSNEKRIEVHEGERIRWTDSDKRDGRGMINATIASIEKVDRDGIVVKLADGELRELKNGDPMLKRMDLAYAINTHMAQGITNETVFSVMGAGETNLSNARAFLVNHTRQQMDVRLFTDDKAKLIRQLESNRGDKTSALEAIGELAVDRILSGKDGVLDTPTGDEAGTPTLADLERKLDLGSSLDVGAADTAEKPETKGTDVGGPSPAEGKAARKPVAPAPREEHQLDRSKGLEL